MLDELRGRAAVWEIRSGDHAVCAVEGVEAELHVRLERPGVWSIRMNGLDGEVVERFECPTMEAAVGRATVRTLAGAPERSLKALSILRVGKGPRRSGGAWRVPSQSDADRDYRVDPVARTCDCSDFRYRRTRCKHLRAVEALVG